jgi:[glutamine synthetase] adenylyltransferase / [glutamine synthetase]-adenylyl-L-tyrosine phosphorylase
MPDDKQIMLTVEDAGAAGILDLAQALRNVELLRLELGPDAYSALLRPLLNELSWSADPDMALNNFERYVNALNSGAQRLVSLCHARPDILHSLVTVLGASRFLSTYLITSAVDTLAFLEVPELFAYPAGKESLLKRLAIMIAEIRDDEGFARTLRRFRKQEMFRIGLRDLLGKADLQEIVGELSDLAEVCLDQAYAWVNAGLNKRYGKPVIQCADGTVMDASFAIIAMGKLGGRELNFSSDVDLMYVYRADGETTGIRSTNGKITNRITNHQYFIKMAEKISVAIGQNTEDGFVFRVDLRLRPEGQQGPLAQSLGGYEIYYESWGQTWERSALIKARPVAGNESLGRDFQDRITPFVYRKYLDYSAIAEIREMKHKINKDVEQKGKIYRDVKLGYGGIREIEFIIQALQLIYAGRDQSLREKNALKALHMLSQKGLITYQEHEILANAYVFLRTVEHRIQIVDDLQTQTLPVDDKELRALARRTGYHLRGRETELLLRDYVDHTRKVRSIFDNLFSFTGEGEGPQSSSKDYTTLLDPETSEHESVSLLEKLGFRDPGKAYRNLLLLRDGAAYVHQTPRSRKVFNEMFPKLLEQIIASPDPDSALNHLESFLATQGSWDVFYSLVKSDASALRVLVAIFANSEYLSRMLVSRPQYLQNMLDSGRTTAVGTYMKFEKVLTDALEQAEDTTMKLDALRLFKHQEEIRIGMADLLSHARPMTVFHDLAKLAEVCLNAALNLAAKETSKRYGSAGSFSGLAIIGVGKLGGRELTYGSDLDILFVFSEPRSVAPPTGLTVFEYFNKVAEKTLAYLSTITREGFVFRVDTRLRPTGSKGPLVRSITAFKQYYAEQAETWELQTLLQARCAAGDRIVGAEFTTAIHKLIYQKRDHTLLAHDILMMRKRMEEEIGRESSAHYNIKQGAGGIVDIEFLVQYLQLLYGHEHAMLRVPGTYNALRALHKWKLIEDGKFDILKRAYLFLRQLESRMRIISDQATSELSRNPENLYLLARRMGYVDSDSKAGQALLSDYERLSLKVREIYSQILHMGAG